MNKSVFRLLGIFLVLGLLSFGIVSALPHVHVHEDEAHHDCSFCQVSTASLEPAVETDVYVPELTSEHAALMVQPIAPRNTFPGTEDRAPPQIS